MECVIVSFIMISIVAWVSMILRKRFKNGQNSKIIKLLNSSLINSQTKYKHQLFIFIDEVHARLGWMLCVCVCVFIQTVDDCWREIAI